ncbi:acyl-CoA-binding domain-containing protein 5A-like protein, partial [Dinothrombium tinctorium]
MSVERKTLCNMSTEEKFKAAVNVIKSLPKDGHFQPSNELKLKFYSYFKQATEGPNQTPKPPFYDLVARYKWEAWKQLGSMSKEEAMNNYIEQLKKIVETMAFNEQISEFYDVLGPFYEMVNESPKKSHNKMNGDVHRNGNDLLAGYKFTSSYSPVNGLENGNNSDPESDGEEFSDTFDHVANGNDLSPKPVNGIVDDIISARGETDVSSRRLNPGSLASRPMSSRLHLNRGVSNPTAFDPSSNAYVVSGASGGGSGGSGHYYVSTMAPDVNEQMALAILRLQQSLDQINSRINLIETRMNSVSH